MLPSGERRIALAPIGGPIERLLYWAMCLGVTGLGLGFWPRTAGYLITAGGVMLTLIMYRIARRKETWRLEPAPRFAP